MISMLSVRGRLVTLWLLTVAIGLTWSTAAPGS